MTLSTLAIFLLFFALTFSWLYFLSYFYRSRRRAELAVKNFEDVKAEFRDEVSIVNSLMEFLTHLHQLALEGNGGENKICKLAKMVIDYACSMTSCALASVMVYDQTSKKLSLIALHGFANENGSVSIAKLGEEITMKALKNNEPVIVEDIKKEYPFRTMMAYPLKIWGKNLGVLSLYSEEPHWQLDEKKTRYLRALTQQCALAMESVSRSSEAQKFLAEMVQPLIQLLEAKDGAQDSAKIRFFAREVAKEFRLPEPILLYIEFAALLRGIGKIWLDDLVLQKPGFLTPRELEQVKMVPEYGQRMIENVEFLSPVKPMILYHQEKWDGSGYPKGLKAEEIPLGSRIVGVVSAYHAMTTDRPYRKALTDGEAIGELKVQAGVQFDPKVVDAFVRVFEKEKGNSRGLESITHGSRSELFPSLADNFWEWN